MTVTVTVSGQSGSLANGFTYVAQPTVTSVSPNSGTTAGGTAVTITGTNFAAGATVTFGSAAATNVVVVSGTKITATTPAGSAGAVTVTVTVSGQSGSLTSAYTYVVTPTVSSVSPNTGTTAGGTSVTINGSNFAAGATVTFGGTAATNVVVVSRTQITAKTPAGSAGAGDSDGDGERAEREPGQWVYLRCSADSEQCESEYWDDGGRNGGDDHWDELCGRSDGDVRQCGSDQCGGGERDADHGDDTGGECGRSDSDGDQLGLASGSLANGFTYTTSVAISFAQVAAATPQTRRKWCR